MAVTPTPTTSAQGAALKPPRSLERIQRFQRALQRRVGLTMPVGAAGFSAVKSTRRASETFAEWVATRHSTRLNAAAPDGPATSDLSTRGVRNRTLPTGMLRRGSRLPQSMAALRTADGPEPPAVPTVTSVAPTLSGVLSRTQWVASPAAHMWDIARQPGIAPMTGADASADRPVAPEQNTPVSMWAATRPPGAATLATERERADLSFALSHPPIPIVSWLGIAPPAPEPVEPQPLTAERRPVMPPVSALAASMPATAAARKPAAGVMAAPTILWRREPRSASALMMSHHASTSQPAPAVVGRTPIFMPMSEDMVTEDMVTEDMVIQETAVTPSVALRSVPELGRSAPLPPRAADTWRSVSPMDAKRPPEVLPDDGRAGRRGLTETTPEPQIPAPQPRNLSYRAWLTPQQSAGAKGDGHETPAPQNRFVDTGFRSTSDVAPPEAPSWTPIIDARVPPARRQQEASRSIQTAVFPARSVAAEIAGEAPAMDRADRRSIAGYGGAEGISYGFSLPRVPFAVQEAPLALRQWPEPTDFAIQPLRYGSPAALRRPLALTEPAGAYGSVPVVESTPLVVSSVPAGAPDRTAAQAAMMRKRAPYRHEVWSDRNIEMPAHSRPIDMGRTTVRPAEMPAALGVASFLFNGAHENSNSEPEPGPRTEQRHRPARREVARRSFVAPYVPPHPQFTLPAMLPPTTVVQAGNETRESAMTAHQLAERAPERLYPATGVGRQGPEYNGLAIQRSAPGSSPANSPAAGAPGTVEANAETEVDPAAAANDIHLLANEVWYLLKRRLAVEAERSGH